MLFLNKCFSHVYQSGLFVPTLTTFFLISQFDTTADPNFNALVVVGRLTQSSTFFLMWVLLTFTVRDAYSGT